MISRQGSTVAVEEYTVPAHVKAQKHALATSIVWMYAVLISIGSIAQVFLVALGNGVHDPIFMVLGAPTIFVSVAIAIKFVVVRLFGAKIDHRYDGTMQTHMLTCKPVFWTVFCGGVGQAAYNVLVLILASMISPGLLTAGRALVLVHLGVFEIATRVIPAGNKRTRVLISMLVSIVGTAIFSLTAHWGSGNLGQIFWFFALVGPGNAILAAAEVGETWGTRYMNVPVYTYWRFVCFGIVTGVAFLLYALIKAELGWLWPFLQLMLSRWYLILVLAPAVAAGDLGRIWAKSIIANAHVQSISATVPGLTVVFQIIAALVIGGAFAKLVSITPFNLALWAGGSILLFIGAKCFPKLHNHTVKNETLAE